MSEGETGLYRVPRSVGRSRPVHFPLLFKVAIIDQPFRFFLSFFGLSRRRNHQERKYADEVIRKHHNQNPTPFPFPKKKKKHKKRTLFCCFVLGFGL